MAETRRILIVDHEPRAVLDMGRVLRSAGYEVLESPTGKECLGLVREKRPHLILIDEALSDISGIDLVRQIKRDAELSRAYVVLLSREGTAPAIQARALENGADALMLRTFLAREFLARVEALLRRQASEESLRNSLQDYRATFDAMSDAVYLVNMEYKVVDCNLAMARFLAKPRGEIVGGRCYELVHGTGKPIPACLGQRVGETRRRETLVVPMEERWLQVDVDPLLDASGAVVGSVHVLRDITERRRTEEALQQAQAEMELRAAEHHLALDKASKDLLVEVEARQRTQEVLKGSQAELELRNREFEELTQARQSAEENLQRVQRELRTVAAQASDLVYTWEPVSGQAHLVSDAQGRFTSEASGFPATFGELQGMIHPHDRVQVAKTLAQHVAAGTPWSAEYRVIHHDGQVAHWAVSAVPLERDAVAAPPRTRDAVAAPLGDGPTQEWMAVVRDVTAVRRAEREKDKLRAQLHLTQKMEALRRLAAGVANEFNRLLAMILGQIELILARIEPSHPLYSDLQAIAKVTRQGVSLIRQLLAFAGREVVQPELLDVNTVMQKLKPKLRRALGKGIELQFALAPQLRPVLADARVLEDIWLNLVAHAAAAMPREGGVLRVHTAGATLTDAYTRTNPTARPGDYVRVTLAYRSGALSAAASEDPFELQFAPSEAGVGRELGLGVVYGLVQQLGGFIEVTQTAAEETAWEVYLPAHPAEGAEEQGGGGAEVQGRTGAGEAGLSTGHPAAPEPLSVAAVEPEITSAVVEAGAMPSSPVAEAPAPDMPQDSTPDMGGQLGAPAADTPAPVQEATGGVPPAIEGAAAEPLAEVPAWLVEPTHNDDITTQTPNAGDTSDEPTRDITEAEAPSAEPSGLAGIGSRLRRRLGKKRATH